MEGLKRSWRVSEFVVRGFSEDIGVQFWIDKWVVLVLKQGVKVRCEGIVSPDGQVIVVVDENGYKYIYLPVVSSEGVPIIIIINNNNNFIYIALISMYRCPWRFTIYNLQ